MADTVHNLQVRTTVKDLASKELRGLGKSGASAGKSIAAGFIKAQLALGALKVAIRGVVGAIRSMTVGVAENLDKMAKMSRQFGIGIDKLDQLRHIADLAGSDFNDLSRSMQILARNVNQMVEGFGTPQMEKAFEDVGLSVDSLRGKEVDELLFMIADGFDKITSSTKRLGVARELFGRSGISFINILEQGGDALRGQAEEAVFLTGRLTTAMGKIAEDFIDARARFTRSIEGIKRALAVELLPALTAFLNKVAVFVAENRTKIVDGLKDVFTTVGGMVLTAFQELSLQFARLIDMIESLQKLTAQDIAKKFAANTVRSALTLFGTPKGGADAAVLGIFGSTSGPREKAMLEFWARVDVAISKVKDNLASMASDKGAPGTGISGASIWSGISDAVNDEASTGNGAKVVASDIWHAITEAMGEVPPEPVKPGFLDGIRKAVAGIREQLTPEALGMTTVSMLTNAWTNFFDAIVFGSEKAEDAFRNMAISMLRQVSQMANQAFMSEIFGALSGAGGGGGAGAGEPQNIGQASGQLRNSSGMRLQIRQAAGSGL